MEYGITNGILSARVDMRGAQLKSLTLGGVEYIWPGGEEWAWSAPVCCPWCGAVEGGEFTHGSVSYAAPRHGFVRDCAHGLTERSEDSLTFEFAVQSAEHALWPWPFKLTAHYALDGSSLTLTYTIVNTGSETMPLQLGFHPGFIAPAGSVIRSDNPDLPGGTDTLPLTHGLFDAGSIDLTGPKSEWFTLERGDGHSVTVDTAGWPYVLLWGAPGETPFACIEPWSGYPGPGTLFERPGAVLLRPGENFERTLKLKLN